MRYFVVNNGMIIMIFFQHLIFACIPDSTFEEGMFKEIERVLSIAQIYHLEIVEKK